MLGYIKSINKEQLKKVLLWTFILGIIAHGYCYFNGNFSHDCLNALIYSSEEYIHQISIGRFLRPLYSMIKGDIELPLINGLLSLLFIGISAYLVIDIMELKKDVSKFFVCAIMVTNYSVTLLNATYLHDSDCYGLALVFSVLGILCFRKINKGYLYALIFCFLSLGLYQAYIQVTIILLIICSIKDLISNKNYNEVLKSIILGFLIIGISMILYFVTYKAALLIGGIEQSTDNNSISSAVSLSISGIISNIFLALKTEAVWFLLPRANNTIAIVIINFVMVILSIFVIFKTIIRNKIAKNNIIILILLLLVSPFAISSIIIISAMKHDLIIYAWFLLYVLVILLIEQYDYKKISIIITILFAIMTIDNCIYSNQVYLKKELESQSTLSLMTRLIDRIEQNEEYVVGETPVAITGYFNDSQLTQKRDKFDYRGTGLQYGYAVTYYSSYKDYFNYYLSYPINILSKTESQEIAKKEEVKAMPSFPASGSCRMIDGIMIVKLSD